MPTNSIFKSLYLGLNKGETQGETGSESGQRFLIRLLVPTFARGAQASRPNSPKCIFCLELFLVSSLFEDILLYKLSFQQHLIWTNSLQP